MTMTFLVLEATSNLAITGLVLVAAIACSLTVRLAFGYSFSTWRMHLRGESIRGAQDVGVLRDLTVARLMRANPPVFPAHGTIGDLRARFAEGGSRVVVLSDAAGGYAGLVRMLMTLNAPPDAPASTLAICPDRVLRPDMNVQEALGLFDGAGTPVLAALDAAGAIVGVLDEADALHAYAQALEAQRRSLAGEEPGR